VTRRKSVNGSEGGHRKVTISTPTGARCAPGVIPTPRCPSRTYGGLQPMSGVAQRDSSLAAIFQGVLGRGVATGEEPPK